MAETFTAWLIDEPALLAGPYIELRVTSDDDTRKGTLGTPRLNVCTKEQADGGDLSEALGQAMGILRTRNWRITGTAWTATPGGLFTTVEPV